MMQTADRLRRRAWRGYLDATRRGDYPRVEPEAWALLQSRLAGLVPRRFATRDELLRLLRDLGEQLGRVPTAKDIEARKGSMPSKSLYWHTFGSLNNALKEAGFDVPVGEERLERAIDQGSALALRVGRLPKFADWAQARRADDAMLTEWQVYRMFDARRGAWSTFQFLIRKRLEDTGVAVSPEGRIG